jgi:hypothetical protein
MSGDHVDEKQPKQIPVDRIGDHQAAQEHANQSFLADAYDWVVDNPVKATAIGIAAAAGVGYLTRSAWMPLAARLAPEATDAAIAATGKKAAFDAGRAGLTSLAEVGAPELAAWRGALGGYSDVGLDQAGSLIYRGAKAGAFAADNVLVVNGATEANTLFKAVSREGLLQRSVWPKGAAGSAAEFGEIELPGRTRFLFEEGKAVEVQAGGKLINLKNGEFHALNKDAAEKLYSGLQKF